MAKRILNIVDQAYRATLEEQDDPVLWIAAVLKGNGGDVSVLLRGAAVNYGVKGQDASGLRFGGKKQTRPPKIDEDLKVLLGKGVPVSYVEEDLAERGIEKAELLEGLTPLRRADLAKTIAGYDLVWHW